MDGKKSIAKSDGGNLNGGGLPRGGPPPVITSLTAPALLRGKIGRHTGLALSRRRTRPRPHPRLAETSIRDYTDDMAAYVERFAEPPIIIGHSMGGLIGQQLAANWPL